MLRAVLGDLGADVETAADGDAGLLRIAERSPDLALLDMRMPGLSGLDVLEALRRRGDPTRIVVLTAHADLDDAVRAMKLGATDYLRKPIDLASLRALLDLPGLRARVADNLQLPDDVVAESPLMRDACRDLWRVAQTDVPILLSGETGSGKDVLARLAHRFGQRAAGPYIAVNVAALPDALVEGELFGVERGAFTGADARRSGRFQDADGGTLFLDEIGELSLALQPKLLRVLQDRRVTPLGGGRATEVDFRLVAATNRDLEAAVAAGAFRQDLYYRLAVVVVEVPPLRERPEDVRALAPRFLASAGVGRKRLSPAAWSALLGYRWPGNVRELENAMLRAAILAPGDTVLPEHLPPAIRAAARDASGEDELSLAELEKRTILDALERTDGNRSEAARLLGISRRKLLYRLKEYRADGAGSAPGHS
ncbi:MAG: sigma-54-dependent Fis family transcriptional regulator [Planctomycetes bacterium]|nr:sigma-54-dependent Fis family transcriptional regulator [Planctomycetota bacterium]